MSWKKKTQPMNLCHGHFGSLGPLCLSIMFSIQSVVHNRPICTVHWNHFQFQIPSQFHRRLLSIGNITMHQKYNRPWETHLQEGYTYTKARHCHCCSRHHTRHTNYMLNTENNYVNKVVSSGWALWLVIFWMSSRTTRVVSIFTVHVDDVLSALC